MNGKLWQGIAGLVGAVAFGLAACGGGNNETPPLTGAFRIANGIGDSDVNGLDVRLLEAFQFNAIAFGYGSGIKLPPVGSYTADFDINGQPFTVQHIQITHNDLATVLTYGSVAAATYNGFAAYQSLTGPASSDFAVQLLHSAYQASLATPTLSYYLVPAGSGGIGSATPTTAPFATSTATIVLPAGSYRIFVTNGSTVLYDSGAGAGVALPPTGTNVLQLAALDAPGSPNGSAISLLLLDNDGGGTPLLNGAH